MLKIATHDSVTGEKGNGLFSWLITPFAKTQSKTIAEQYEAGCRMFDIRVKKTKRGWVCAHGIWQSKRMFSNVVTQLNSFEDRCHVLVTYEGTDKHNDELIELMTTYMNQFENIIWGPVSVKYGKDSNGVKVKYDIIMNGSKLFGANKQGFLPLDGRSWHTFIPIPWLWKKIYNNKPEFNEDCFIFVDFL